MPARLCSAAGMLAGRARPEMAAVGRQLAGMLARPGHWAGLDKAAQQLVHTTRQPRAIVVINKPR